MIVIDTSALIAIMSDELERRAFNECIEAAESVQISAATLLEARMVLYSRSGDGAVVALDAFMLKSRMETVEVSPEMADIAFDAYRKFGKGMGHAANLNYGDCFAYALAKHSDAPLLYKGNDFAHTDIASAV